MPFIVNVFRWLVTVLALTSWCFAASDSVVVFNELMYHPPAEDATGEWVELHNQMAVDVDISGWSLTRAVEYRFAKGTLIPGGGFLVVSIAPQALAARTGLTNILGPYSGRLSNSGDDLELRNNNGRLMDELQYGTDVAWPPAADGTGASLSKRHEDLATGNPENWGASRRIGGTPGVRNDVQPGSDIGFNELAAGGDLNFWLELANCGEIATSLTGYIVAQIGSAIREYVITNQTLAPKGYRVITRGNLEFSPEAGDLLILFTPDRNSVLDAVRVKKTFIARSRPVTGEWLTPSRPTPGTENQFVFHNDIVINEIMYHHAPILGDETRQFQESSESWLELYNRSNQEVDLSGWSLDGGISYQFSVGQKMNPGSYLVVAKNVASLQSNFPNISAVGPFANRLSGRSDLIRLSDQNHNPVNQVRYFAGRPWPDSADGGGSSLELRDPRSNNARPEAWAASDESSQSGWQNYTYRALARPGINGEPSNWKELALGMLSGAGEVLLDDIRLTESTSQLEFIQNGDFQTGTKNHWRFLGNHQRSVVESEPGNPANYVLHVVASGPTEYQGNQIETTVAPGRSIVNGREYQLSFRARWLVGSRQLNTRLYFDRLPRTTILEAPSLNGTPGRQNSRFSPNAGPTFGRLRHRPVVPQPTEPVEISVEVADPDEVEAVTLNYSIAGGAWGTIAMTHAGSGVYSTLLGARPASTVVHFYVEASDTVGGRSVYPAGGPESRALYKVNDGLATGQLVHNLRVIMTPSDANYLHLPVNVLSNEQMPCTVIYKEQEVFYDAGVRLKGSYVGRNVPRVGFNILFPSDHLFRGIHERVAIDRSLHANIGQAEIVMKHIASHAGGIPGMYDDLIHFVSPKVGYTSKAQLRMAAFDQIYLDSQFKNGSDGTLYEFEVIRIPSSTVDGNPESLKNPGGSGYVNLDIQNYGDNKENYRWIFLISNNRERDDYSEIIQLGKAFSLSGAALDAASQRVMDVDEWLRSFAYESLLGCADAYFTGANHHNLRLYVRPDDRKVMAMPWDWDSGFQLAIGAPLIGGANLAKIVNRPANRRRYYQHLEEIIATTFNANYMRRWTTHYGLLAGENYAGHLSYISQRANYVSNQLLSLFGPVAFGPITTNDTLVNAKSVTIAGNAGLHVRDICLAGETNALPVVWSTFNRWEVILPVVLGTNSFRFVARDSQGEVLSEFAVQVTGTFPDGGVDTDKDGMPDIWEISNGLNPLVADANSDPDGDGVSSYEEYLSGTDPRVKASVLKLDSALVSPVILALNFNAVAGRSYSLQARTAWVDGVWQKLRDIEPAPKDRVVEKLEIIGPKSRFYRVVMSSAGQTR